MEVLMNKQQQVEKREKSSNYVTNPSKNSTFHLPLELVVEILSRLPVKSLLQFSSVCKTWKSMIKSTNFISMHLQKYPLTPNLNCSSLIVASDKGKKNKTKEYETCFCFENALYKPVNVDFSDLGQTDYLVVIGVCDGLICVSLSYDECDVVIYNPGTRQLNRIPPCQPWKIKNKWVIFGFCFIPNADDYKLVRITHTRKSSSEIFLRADIYSVNSNVWRLIHLNMPSEVESCEPTAVVVIKGVSYWTVKKLNPSHKTVIVSFDMNDEVLQLVDTLKCCQSNTFWLVRLKEELAMVVDFYEERIFDVWLFDAVTRSWSKKFKFKLLPETEFCESRLIGGTKNGNLVFQNTKDGVVELYSYDPLRKDIKSLLFGKDDYDYMSFCYVESLIPVKKKDQTLTEKLWS